MGFLNNVGRLHRYGFADQVLIYAQNPDVTAAAPAELWHKRFDRQIKIAEPGIALLDDDNAIRYVYDVSQTEPLGENSKEPDLWRLGREQRGPVLKSLANTFDVPDNSSLESFCFGLAQSLSARYYEDNKDAVNALLGKSTIGLRLNERQRVQFFIKTVADSALYAVMSRCEGADSPRVEDIGDNIDRIRISWFNTSESISLLGEAASGISNSIRPVRKFKQCLNPCCASHKESSF